ncbi:hypothetical protein EPA93_32550 [Ktedonosporobacter rubrisoli]|uniref:Septum formation initiator family protein n=1 Tax=Ktedonosporobacter rubrisoli TaxID=2509675 RepID=A0A4P6JXH0_KTERU|nr:septum formation initiator family protein [Ktedonosporobacter rubrisoli]QBD80449.1 hypothetical protein EPA93_32550 [Ktedonosporobacter rubrisoli]
MQNRPRRPQFTSRTESGNTANVTSAIGMEESAGRLRARRNTLFTHTIMWVTGLICIALLLGSFAQAWSNSRIAQQVQQERQQLQQLRDRHNHLVQMEKRYKDPAVIESEARQQLGYIRHGEQPVVIVSADGQGQQKPPAQQKKPIQGNFWQEWWSTFFGK